MGTLVGADKDPLVASPTRVVGVTIGKEVKDF